MTESKDTKKHHNALPQGFKLHWYVIKDVLGRGGFGITYLAHDTNLERDVAIKEYLPVEFSFRDQTDSVNPIDQDEEVQYKWGLERFITEAKTLAKFEHPNIVRVISVFEENNTGYMVMNYEKGVELNSLIQKGNTLDEKEILKIILPLLEGLEKIHNAGFIHRDIKPQNILIRPDGSPVLIDFGSARQSLGQKTKTLTSLVSPGYAPFEQYYSKSDKQGPWTDIYACAATLYRCVSGRSPISAVDRSEAIVHGSKDLFVSAEELGMGKYSEELLKAIDHGLKFKPSERPQSISEWMLDFKNITKPTMPMDEIDTGIATVLSEIEKDLKNIDAKENTLRIEQKRKTFKTGVLLASIVLIVFIMVVNRHYIFGLITSGDEADVAVEQQPVRQDDQENKENGILALLSQAQESLDKRNYTRPVEDNAYYYYKKVLATDPDNNLAINGIKKIKEDLYDSGQEAITAGDLATARVIVTELENIDPDNQLLVKLKNDLKVKQTEILNTQVEKEIAKRKQEEERLAAQKNEAEVKDLLVGAEKNIQDLKLVTPEGDNAYEKYRRVLELDQNNARANAGLQTIAEKYLGLARQSAETGDYDEAIKRIAVAEKISPNLEQIKFVREEIVLMQKAEQEAQQAKLDIKKDQEAASRKEATLQAERIRQEEEARLAKLREEEERLRIEQERLKQEELARQKALQEQAEQARLAEEEKKRQEEALKKQEEETLAASVAVNVNQIDEKYQRLDLNSNELMNDVKGLLTSSGFNIIDTNQVSGRAKQMDLVFNPKKSPSGKLIGWNISVSVSQEGNNIWSAQDERTSEAKKLYGIDIEPRPIENLTDAKNSFMEMVRIFIISHHL